MYCPAGTVLPPLRPAWGAQAPNLSEACHGPIQKPHRHFQTTRAGAGCFGSQPVVDRQYRFGVATGQPAQRVMGVQVPERPGRHRGKTSSGVAPPPLGGSAAPGSTGWSGYWIGRSRRRGRGPGIAWHIARMCARGDDVVVYGQAIDTRRSAKSTISAAGWGQARCYR